MKTTVFFLALMLAGLGAAYAQQTTTSPFGPTTPGSPSMPGSSFSYNPSLPGGMGYSPYATIPSSSFGYPTSVNPFTSTIGTPGTTFGSPGATLGMQQATGRDSSMFNAMFGLNPAALNPFSLFGSPTTLNPFSMFFGNTAIAPTPAVSTPTTPSAVPTPTPAQTAGG